MNFKAFLENNKIKIFPKIGELPIPEGTVRLYHQTPSDNVPSIEKHGILKSKSKGKNLKEPVVIWATEKPFYTNQKGMATIEFFVPHEQFRSPTYVLGDKVPPEQILFIHEEWKDIAQALIEDYPEPPNKEYIEDFMTIDDDYKKAAIFYLNYMKKLGKI